MRADRMSSGPVRTAVAASTLFIVAGSLLLLINIYAKNTILLALGPLLVAVPALYLSWASIRARSRADFLDAGKASDVLAEQVRLSWIGSFGVFAASRGKYQLQVRWLSAEAGLSDTWEAVQRVALEYAAFEDTPSELPTSPPALDGAGGAALAQHLHKPPGRLVLLGEAGSGKSIALVQAALSMLAVRASGDAVPVLVTARTWDPVHVPFERWLTAELRKLYPAAAGGIERLVAGHRLVVILDGLDETTDLQRREMIPRLNAYLVPGDRLLVASRTDDFRRMIGGSNSFHYNRLNGSRAVALTPLDDDRVAEYVDQFDESDARLVRDSLLSSNASSSIDFLRVPLMLALLLRCMNARSGVDQKRVLLLELASAPDADTASRLLFGRYFEAVFEDRRLASVRYRRRARRWLTAMARIDSGDIGRLGTEPFYNVDTLQRQHGSGSTFILAAAFAAVSCMVAGQYWSGALTALLGLTVSSTLLLGGYLIRTVGRIGFAGHANMVFAMATLTVVDTGTGLIFGILSDLALWPAMGVGIVGGLLLGTATSLLVVGAFLNSDSVYTFVGFFIFPVALCVAIGVKTTATDGLVLGLLCAVIFAYWLGTAFGGLWSGYWFWPVTWALARGDVPFRLNKFFRWCVAAGVLSRYGDSHRFTHVYLRRHLLDNDHVV